MKLLLKISLVFYSIAIAASVYAALLYFGYVLQVIDGAAVDSAVLAFGVAGILVPYLAGASLQRIVEVRRTMIGSSD